MERLLQETDKYVTQLLSQQNGHSMEPQDFKEKLREIRKDTEKIYDSLTMDLYCRGKFLQKKYQLLRWIYTESL